jgi:uncharacterized protein
MGTERVDLPGITDLTSSECLALLRRAVVGRLAVVLEGKPDIFPINYVIDQGTIVFRTQVGAKLSACVGRPVAFEVDGYEDADESAWSVVAKGYAHEIRETYETIEALQLPLFPWLAGSKPYIVRIEPEQLSGRRFHVSREVAARAAGDSTGRSARGAADE